jgi:2-polyprenyl-6-methoxyphenol hydroxylase-like FAD-dependent oxidoreductase
VINDKIQTDILINGAGPTGLMMACLLSMHKIPFRIIDKKAKRENYSGAMIIHSRTMEAFHQMGLSRRFLKEGVIARSINLQFNGKKQLSLDIADFGNGWSLFPYLLMIEQSKTEKILRDFLAGSGKEVEDNTTLLSFKQKKGIVTSVLKNPTGAGEILKTRFLVGAGGSTSLVRRQLQIPFYGHTHKELLFVSDSQADLPSMPSELFFSFSKDHSLGFFPLPDKRWRIDGIIPDLDQTEQPIDFQYISNYMSGRKLNFNMHDSTWFSVFRSHSRIAPVFKHHHCFLVGDAAHISTPVGAQGMNTGLQDAFNLAWKLAFYLKGFANAKILETYQEERMPVVQKTVRITDEIYSWITSKKKYHELLRLYVIPVVLSFFIFLINKIKGLRRFIFLNVSGVGTSYRKSSFSAYFRSSFLDNAPLPGDRLPCIQYFTGAQIFNFQEKVSYTSFNLLIFGVRDLPDKFRAVTEKYKEFLKVEIIPADPGTEDVYRQMVKGHHACYLVRPDMHIAWRSDSFDVRSLDRYLQRRLISVHEPQEA